MKKEDFTNKSPIQKVENDHEILTQLAECIFENLNEELKKETESFDTYACQLKIRFQKNNKDFNERFNQGYECILEAIKRPYENK